VPTSNAPAVELSGDPSGIALSGPDANTFGNGPYDQVVKLDGGAVPVGKSWTVSSAGPAVLVLGLPLVVHGTATLDHGAIVKGGAGIVGLDVEGGTLNANGTAQSPVVITSLKDDTIGDDSGGDGFTHGAANDYAAAIHVGSPPSALNQTFLDVRFATT